MAYTLDWEKIKNELGKLTSVEGIRQELDKIKSEVKSFDIHKVLSPTAKKKLKNLEAKYAEVSRIVARAQRELDRELNRILRQLKTRRAEAEKQFVHLKSLAEEHKSRLKKSLSISKPKIKKRKKATAKRTTKRRKAS